MLPIHYYRCSFADNSVDMVNRHGFCFNERDSDKIRTATSLDDDEYNFRLNIHHGVRVTCGSPMINPLHQCFARLRHERYVIFYDDSFFKAFPGIFQLDEKMVTLQGITYIKKGDPIYSRLPGYLSEWCEFRAYPRNVEKLDEYTITAYSTDYNDYFLINFGLVQSGHHGYTPRGKTMWQYKKKFATKVEADKMMEIFQFYRM